MAKKTKTKKKTKTDWRETYRLDRKKNETISLRLSPKLRYGLELLSRKQHRTVSSVVTWAIQELLNSDDGLRKDNQRVNMLEVLWDVDYADRLVKIATHWPKLMTYEEERLVKTIKKWGWWPTKGDSATDTMLKGLPDVLLDPGDGEYYWNG